MLQSGTRLGPYEILSALGAGGMGEVYKARDTRLDRTVAIKILPETLAADPQFRERFDREARAISQIDHPNICTLYDVGDQQGTSFLVMQYLEGETLETRLKKGALPLDQALTVAIQVASALDKAHRAGIIHRDLKPGNIMLTKTGAKLLDFGLAKANAPVIAGGGLSMLPTTPPNLTAQGTILGTLQYMAPEQLEGHEADARTDIFAFGAVLYEMLTGQRAFEGKTAANLIVAILSAQPKAISELRPLALPSIDRVVSTCLAKDRDDRWQTARDLLRELQWVAAEPGRADLRAGTTTRSHRIASTKFSSLGIVILVGAATLVAVMYSRRVPTPPNVYRTSILLPNGIRFPVNRISQVRDLFALSPDGRRLAFIGVDANGRQALWIRQMDSGTAQPLAETDQADSPFWSPDSRFVAFAAEGKLKRVDASGGPVSVICDAYPNAPPGAWNRDEVIVFTPRSDSGLYRVLAAGGTPGAVTTLDTTVGEVAHRNPFFLPDGRHLLYAAIGTLTQGPNEARGVYVASLDGHEVPRRVLEPGSNAKYSQGRLWFMRGATLMAQAFDPGRLELSGEAEAVAEPLEIVGITGRGGLFSVADTSAVAYRTASGQDSSLVWFDRSGKQIATLGDIADYTDVDLSPDGKRAVVSIRDQTTGTRDLWIFDLTTSLRTRFTFDPADEFAPLWSLDGRHIVFSSRRQGHFDLYQKLSTGAGAEDVLFADRFDKYAQSFSPDGKYLLYLTSGDSKSSGTWALGLSGGQKPFKVAPNIGRLSPDGRWLAYWSSESGRSEIYVVSFPNPTAKWQVTTTGGSFVRWRRDGTELFYLGLDNRLMVAAVNLKGDSFENGATQALFQMRPAGNRYFYDVSADGQRFLINTLAPQAPASSLTLLSNWTPPSNK